MPTPSGPTVALQCHPACRSDAVRRIEVDIRRESGGALALCFRLAGDLARLRVPPPGPARIAHQLWQHTCCEAFVAVDGRAAYHEFNFAPSGQWAAYAFRRYRDGGALAEDALPPGITVGRGDDRLELDVTIRLAGLSSDHPRAALRLALSAVVEDTSGALSYWALHHPPGQPDFHHPHGFALRLEPPNVDSADDSG